jgi:hypothetical protein
MGRVLVEVQQGDVLSYSADVLALKYAQDLYGADLAVYNRLSESTRMSISLPSVGGCIVRNQWPHAFVSGLASGCPTAASI